MGQFQSTLPVRGATLQARGKGIGASISIHAPREGSDRHNKGCPTGHTGFQSTLPVRGATPIRELFALDHPISIHAPREGSDA